MEKIAVHCETKEIWYRVMGKMPGKHLNDSVWGEYGSETCIDSAGSSITYCSRKWYLDNNYPIISAQEYLNEGGKDVKEFKVGDRVECIETEKNYPKIKIGNIYTVKYESSRGKGWLGFEESGDTDTGWPKSWFKLATKTQTTKENNMKSNDINKNVAAVFGDVPGNDLLLVDKHFDSDMMERILMDKHKTAILKACKEAEAEAVKAEKAKK